MLHARRSLRCAPSENKSINYRFSHVALIAVKKIFLFYTTKNIKPNFLIHKIFEDLTEGLTAQNNNNKNIQADQLKEIKIKQTIHISLQPISKR